MKLVISHLEIVIFVILLVSLVIIVVQFLNAKKLGNDISSLNNENQELKNSLQNLNENYNQLNKSYTELNKSYSELNEFENILKKEINSTITKIETYGIELKESMAWFKTNSILNKDNQKQSEAISLLESYCLEKTSNQCHIKTGCFYLINRINLNLDYQSDIRTTGEKDKLQSLNEFIQNGGGDCEDYGLFYKAEFNSILEKCKVFNSSNIVLESYYETEETSPYFIDFYNRWFIDRATKVDLKEGYIYPNVICGNIFDLNLDIIGGHCVVAFTKNKIKSIEDLNNLDKSQIIEPQDGSYMGLINDVSSDIYLITKNNIHNSYIYEVITDEDLFLFSTKYEEWLSYSIFDNELNTQKLELINLMK